MTMQPLTLGMLTQVRGLAARFLDDTYTRVPTVGQTDAGGDPVLDGWGHQVVVSGPPVPGLPCKLVYQDTVSHDERGTVITRRPRLSVAVDDPLAPGDLVTDVADRFGRPLIATATVERLEIAPAVTIADLSGAETVVEPPGIVGP
jgi:hypothetical protein